VAEAGVPGFEVIVWYGMLASAGIPRPIVLRMNQELRTMAAMQDVKDRLAALGAEALSSTPEEFAQRIRADKAKWEKVVKISGARVD
jgi:tripartite-type tricarboxylate transporter receptor subunit TctC